MIWSTDGVLPSTQNINLFIEIDHGTTHIRKRKKHHKQPYPHSHTCRINYVIQHESAPVVNIHFSCNRNCIVWSSYNSGFSQYQKKLFHIFISISPWIVKSVGQCHPCFPLVRIVVYPYHMVISVTVILVSVIYFLIPFIHLDHHSPIHFHSK